MLKKTKFNVHSQKGFTLIEIIAVLVILGILAAVAIPKYMDMQDQARISAAQGAISETKARLTTAYAKSMLQQNGTQPTLANVMALANTEVGSWGPDYNVTVVGTANSITITVTDVQGVALSADVVGNWNMPSP